MKTSTKTSNLVLTKTKIRTDALTCMLYILLPLPLETPEPVVNKQLQCIQHKELKAFTPDRGQDKPKAATAAVHRTPKLGHTGAVPS